MLLFAAGLTDTDLVHRFKAGDRSAFDEIVLRYQDRVFTLCLRKLRERSIAEEVAQDVFVALYRSIGSFRGESKLSTWIFRVTINHCKNRNLYQNRRHRDRHDPLDQPASEDNPPRQFADEKTEGTDRGRQQSRKASRILQEALDTLDESHRNIIILRDIEDLDYEEIAEILSMPRGTVKSRLHRARQDLAKVLRRKIKPEDIL